MRASVVIPTYNRSRILVRTLEALGRQTVLEASEDDSGGGVPYEVIVVDDGSTDDTAGRVRGMSAGYPAPLAYLHQENRKQGAARNLGVGRARGEWLVFLGDDTVPGPGFLEEHLRARDGVAHQDAKRVVAIGYTPWAREYPRTRFMEYVGEEGWQFGFSLIEDPDDVPFNFFYTSNLSISREFFRESGGFDEDFGEYGWEDIELGWRLHRMGMRLVYHPRAVAYHHHPTSVRGFVRRQRRVGSSAWNFYRKHPEMADFLNVGRLPRYRLRDRIRMELLTWVCAWTEKRRWPDLSSLYPDLMSYHYNLGLLSGNRGHEEKRREERGKSGARRVV